MDEDREGVDSLMEMHFEVAPTVSANQRGYGAAGRTFHTQGSVRACALTGGEMSEKGDIDFVQCQRGTYACSQGILATTKVGREHLSAPFQEFEASKPDFRHCPLPGDRFDPCL
jgi:hypothetical protein